MKCHAGRQGSLTSQREGEDPGPRATRARCRRGSGDTGGCGAAPRVSAATRSLRPTARPGRQSCCLREGPAVTQALTQRRTQRAPATRQALLEALGGERETKAGMRPPWSADAGGTRHEQTRHRLGQRVHGQTQTNFLASPTLSVLKKTPQERAI